jgi:hypothetical protein
MVGNDSFQWVKIGIFFFMTEKLVIFSVNAPKDCQLCELQKALNYIYYDLPTTCSDKVNTILQLLRGQTGLFKNNTCVYNICFILFSDDPDFISRAKSGIARIILKDCLKIKINMDVFIVKPTLYAKAVESSTTKVIPNLHLNIFKLSDINNIITFVLEHYSDYLNLSLLELRTSPPFKLFAISIPVFKI